MTQCIDFVLPVSPTDPAIPIDRADEVLSAGSLFLVDVANWPAGVPASGFVVPSLASEEATALGIANSNLVLNIAASLVSSAGLTERTPKGGLHTIIPQASPLASGIYNSIELTADLIAYLLANTGHSFYFSLWTKNTRIANGAPSGIAYSMIRGSANTNQVLFNLNHDRTNPAAPAGLRTENRNGLGDSFQSIGVNGWVNAPTASIGSAGQRAMALWGSGSPINSSAGLAAFLPSYVFYRCYLEDLTVSGRTYAEVDALDHSMWQDAFGVGGRFSDDTFTTPTTKP